MELNITEQVQQESLKRTEVSARIFTGSASPSRQAVADALAEELGADRDLVIVERIYPAFGEASAQIKARVYTDKDVMTELERANLIEKNKKVEPEPQEEPEEPAQESSEEPAEESSEEESQDEEEKTE